MPQSPLGYSHEIPNDSRAHADEALDVQLMHDEIAGGLGHQLDVAPQHLLTFGARVTGERWQNSFSGHKAGDYKLVYVTHPFPLGVLPSGQPEPVRCIAVISTDDASRETWVRAELLHENQNPVEPYESGDMIDGWNLLGATTTSTTGEEVELDVIDGTRDAAFGMLQFPEHLWYRYSRHDSNVGDDDEDFGPIEMVWAKVAFFLGISVATNATAMLRSFHLRACSYGKRDTDSWT